MNETEPHWYLLNASSLVARPHMHNQHIPCSTPIQGISVFMLLSCETTRSIKQIKKQAGRIWDSKPRLSDTVNKLCHQASSCVGVVYISFLATIQESGKSVFQFNFLTAEIWYPVILAKFCQVLYSPVCATTDKLLRRGLFCCASLPPIATYAHALSVTVHVNIYP